MRMLRAGRAAALVLAAACGRDLGVAPPPPLVLHLGGTVTSAASLAPIAGATVTIDAGPPPLDSARTDPAGRWVIVHALDTLARPCRGSWGIEAGAPGFVGAYHLSPIRCTADSQTFDLRLELVATGSGRVPLTDLAGGQNYLGFAGGLYPGGNAVPAAHRAAGIQRALAVGPRDTSGAPSPGGRYVLLSIGMSNTTQEFCSGGSALPCDAWTFVGRAAADPAVNHTSLAVVNGAMGGRSAAFWDSPAEADYDRVRDTRLAPLGLTERQVEVVWVKVANPGPTASLPAAQADAYVLETQLGNIARALKTRYPNLVMVLMSSRIYGGYATTTLNPEPYAYESGLAVKWLIAAQIGQVAAGGTITDPRAGDLDLASGAPWLAWGPYLWADGANPRSDGLTWVRGDLEGDGTHPSQSGESKVGMMLLDFFKTSPFTVCWFAGGSCS